MSVVDDFAIADRDFPTDAIAGDPPPVDVDLPAFAEVPSPDQTGRIHLQAVVDPAALVEAGILKNVLDGVRVLGDGELSKALTVRAQGFSKTAQQKIEAAGGKVEVI